MIVLYPNTHLKDKSRLLCENSDTELAVRLTALKKAYADTILNTAKEAAARVMVSERRARGYQQELVAVRDEALRTCLRLKQMYDSKCFVLFCCIESVIENGSCGMVKEAEMMSLSKQQKIEELEAQLGEAEDIVGELRMELRESRYQLEKLTSIRQSNEEENKPINEVVSLACEDSSNHERTVVASGIIKPHSSDRDMSINRCSYKENKDPCHHTLPSILTRRRDADALEKGDCPNVEEKENDMELLTTSVSPSEKEYVQFTVKRKRKKDERSGSISPEGGSSSSQEEESRNRRQKTGEKDNVYLDSFNTESSSRDTRRVAQVARQLLPFTEKKTSQENQSDDVS
ncbi:hypothetical protein F2Q70_00040208 [Brassica cretica]|uniref:Uncharacterized protein n=1 Tax=Brassica cretica TaxID=69181 RepID=A0A8S9K7A5_BRACR|nr:hypothetical protein F2Q70_00040208 [Brassica cretica]